MIRVGLLAKSIAGAAALALVAVASVGCSGRDALVQDNELLYRRSQEMLARRKFLEATQLLSDVGLVAPVTDEVDADVKLALADVHFFQAGTVSIVEAQNRYDQFVTFYPRDPRASYARYQIGRCLLLQAEDPENDQDFAHRALSHFDQMIQETPESDPWRQAARVQRMRARQRLAAHEWHVAEFYIDKEIWRGAAGRLSGLIEDYPGIPRREEAFFQLATAQAQLGNPEEACLALDRLDDGYPAGAFSVRARELREEIASAEQGTACLERPDGALRRADLARSVE